MLNKLSESTLQIMKNSINRIVHKQASIGCNDVRLHFSLKPEAYEKEPSSCHRVKDVIGAESSARLTTEVRIVRYKLPQENKHETIAHKASIALLMAGRRLLDVAALFNASRGVASKTVTLKSRQWEVYSQTSSLAKAVKSQTSRITETAKAASFLAGRLNDQTPAWAMDFAKSEAGKDGKETIPSAESTGQTGQSQMQEGLNQDHHYERSGKNTTIDPPAQEALTITQEKADRYPLPDGTIPPAESNIDVRGRDADLVNRTPVEPAKDPLTDTRETLEPRSSGKSTIPLPREDEDVSFSRHNREIQRQAEQQIPAHAADLEGHSKDTLSIGHDEDVFYKPSNHESPVLSSLPRIKIPKQSRNIQGDDEHVSTSGLNADSYSSTIQNDTAVPRVTAVPEQEETPEGVNTDLFYSPRVKKMLGSHAQGIGKSGLVMEGAKGTPNDRTALLDGKDQDTFTVRTSSQDQPMDALSKAMRKGTKSSENDMDRLVDDLKEDAATAAEHADKPVSIRNTIARSSTDC